MRTHRLLGSALAIGLALTLSACAPAAPPRPTPTKTPGQPDPVLIEGGSAEDNLPFFAFLLDGIADDGEISGRSAVDGLVAGGFDKQAMQVSFDQTKTNLSADNIFVSVLVGEQCLLGQLVIETGETAESVQPAVGPDNTLCLIGSTRAIDW